MPDARHAEYGRIDRWPIPGRLAGPPIATGLFAGLLAAALVATLARAPVPRLVWNASSSSRTGLYLVGSTGHPRSGDMVVAWAPAGARALAARRGYLPPRVPLVKPVAAIGGDRVCAMGPMITINGRVAALRRKRDGRRRRLPSWSGCRTLACGELLLLSRGSPAAFDGRYFGISRHGDVIGKARLLWAR